MRVGVTGSSGFVGSALLNSLQASSQHPIPIRLPKSPDALDPIFLKKLLVDLSLDAVVHLAVIRNPSNDYEFAVNAELPALLENAVAQQFPAARFLYIGSINSVLRERRDPYSLSKRQGEAAINNSAAIIIRPAILWSWQSNAGGDAHRIRKYLERALPVHPVPFPGQLYRPVLVEMFADRLVRLLEETDPAGIIDVFGDTPVSVWELANYMRPYTGARLLPVPTSFLENILPPVILRHLPIALRSGDASVPDYTMGPAAEVTWELPFTLPSKQHGNAK